MTLQLYGSVLKQGLQEQCLDLARRLHLELSFDIAVKMANALHCHNLSRRINELKENWVSINYPDPELREDDADDVDSATSQFHVVEEENKGGDDLLGNNQSHAIVLDDDAVGRAANRTRKSENVIDAGAVRRRAPKRSADQMERGKKVRPKNPFAKTQLHELVSKSKHSQGKGK